MFGYACRETPELMPAPIYYAHPILKIWHVNPTGKFVIGELRRRSRGQLEFRHCWRPDRQDYPGHLMGQLALKIGRASAYRALEGA
jgi:hypothetical protein